MPASFSPSNTKNALMTLKQQLPNCMLAHRYPLQRKLQQALKSTQSIGQEGLLNLQEQIESSISRRSYRLEQLPQPEYPDLPVSAKKDEIKKAIADNQVVIIAGETGSGKTTQIPKICLELGRGVAGFIGHTQPRRLAARSVATRIAEELGSPMGQQVGFKIRFSDQVSENTYVKLMTDGILLAEIQQDRFLNQYDTLIIDEAHERSLNIDFILGYLKQLLPKRPDFKLIITSATIDPERFSKHFGDAPIIQVSGRTYPVEVRYRPFDDPELDLDQGQAIVEAVNELGREGQGDILVFLSGEREIRDTAELLQRQQLRHTEIVPLYARLSAAEQNRIFQSHSGRRIVLATNVAETSLTVPGIKYVIDPGTARISRYSYRSKVQRLPIEPISQASANQRAGRCGRVSEGICIRLYSEDDFNNRDEFTDPEILRTNLASVIIQMLSLGLGDLQAFPFVQPPDARSIKDGFRLLEELQALSTHQQKTKLTEIGKRMARLPVDPRYARILVAAAEQDCLSELITITAGLSIQDPRERPHEKRQAADQLHNEYADKDSDFITLLKLWNLFKEQQQALSNNQLRKWCKSHFINYLRMREWQDIVSQLKKSVAELGYRLTSQEADYDRIHQALLPGLLSHLGFRDKEREYLGARNSRYLVFPGSPMAKATAKWIVCAELMETSRLFARMVAKIQPEWIEQHAQHLIKKHYSEPFWSKKRGAVQASERVTLYGLTIVAQRHVNYSQIDPQLCRALFAREALVNGETKLNYGFLTHNQRLVAEVESMEDKSRRQDILVDEQVLVDFYVELLPEHVCSEASFKKWWQKQSKQQPELLKFAPESLKKQDAAHVNTLNYPAQWYQGNLTLALDYKFEPNALDDGVSLLIPLALLNQVQEQGFDWLVPGMRHEKIVSLIKGLPKRLRKNFVPAPNYADACVNELSAQDSKGNSISFVQALTTKLFRMTGVKLEEQDWQLSELAAHLTMNFKVLDDKGGVLKQGRDLHQLKQALQGKVTATLQKVATPELEQQGITKWDFDTLPDEFITKNAGFEVRAYPALQAEKGGVAIKLFDQKEKAMASHQQGLRQLVWLNIPSPVKYLQEKLPNKAKLGLYFNPFGQVKALIDDCIAAGIDQLIQTFQQQQQLDIREQRVFNQCCDFVRADINEVVLKIAEKVERGLTNAHSVQKKLKGNVPLNLINGHAQVKQHLQSLVFAGFVSEIGASRLDDWNRYIEAIVKRFEKLPIDPNKDRLHQLNLDKVVELYQSHLAKVPQGQMTPQALTEVRWMIEELRVSFFAQQLGTKIPISAKRIFNHLDTI